jgi:hypothetical protein
VPLSLVNDEPGAVTNPASISVKTAFSLSMIRVQMRGIGCHSKKASRKRIWKETSLGPGLLTTLIESAIHVLCAVDIFPCTAD